MTLRLMSFLVAATILAAPVGANAPETSMIPVVRPGGDAPDVVAEVELIRPVMRPDIEVVETPENGNNPPAIVEAEGDAEPLVVEVSVTRLAVSPFPVPRPRVVIRNAPPKPTPEVAPTPERIVPVSASPVTRVVPPRPEKRPKGLLAAIFNTPNRPSKYPREGSVCGDTTIRGQTLPPIPAKLRGCGQANPVRITAVDGVVLSTPATLNCQTARALRSWVTNVVKPTVGRHGGGVAGLKVAASYACRTRNNVPGAKVSEHGRGNAIDISAILLKNGTAMTVLRGWRDKVQGPLLKAIHAKACGTFGTVLGPRADRYHQDHFHFDTAKHGYGPYCR